MSRRGTSIRVTVVVADYGAVHGSRYTEVIDQEHRFAGGSWQGVVAATAAMEAALPRTEGRNRVRWLVSQEQPKVGATS